MEQLAAAQLGASGFTCTTQPFESLSEFVLRDDQEWQRASPGGKVVITNHQHFTFAGSLALKPASLVRGVQVNPCYLFTSKEPKR